jgi:hypothetical protein
VAQVVEIRSEAAVVAVRVQLVVTVTVVLVESASSHLLREQQSIMLAVVAAVDVMLVADKMQHFLEQVVWVVGVLEVLVFQMFLAQSLHLVLLALLV